ncbi:MAG: hypothetical protein EP338_11230 [Bacteroidetes bacterium]|nr:MAG: hypothetical protein EP338_11230 [Bacteroidota bacterium]
MRNFILNLLKFSLLTALLYLLFLFLSGQFLPALFRPNLVYKKGAYGHSFSRLQEMDSLRECDLLFLGSSHCYRGFDPRIFERYGYSSFNLGSSSQSPKQTRILLQKYLKQVRPKKVIYEVYPMTFCIDGVEASIDLISNSETDKYAFDLFYEVPHVKTLNTYLYTSMRQVLGMDRNFSEPHDKPGDHYVPGGYVEHDLATFEGTEVPRQQWHFKREQFAAFGQIVRDLKEKNIELILVYAPISKELYQSYSNQQAFDQGIRSCGTYWNFNEIMSLDDHKHFYDDDHLNQQGVTLFNEKLIELLNHPSTQP